MVNLFIRICPQCASLMSSKRKLALHFAAAEGHIEVVKSLLQVHPQGASIPSTKGKLAIHMAARWGKLEIAHQLLFVYPDGVRALDWEGSLPLHDAAREGQYQMSRYLVERFPAALARANLRGEIPLFPAVRSENVDLVVLLLQAFPMGGKHILKTCTLDDNVSSWRWDIVELLLRVVLLVNLMVIFYCQSDSSLTREHLVECARVCSACDLSERNVFLYRGRRERLIRSFIEENAERLPYT
jgi:hypothetical protein